MPSLTLSQQSQQRTGNSMGYNGTSTSLCGFAPRRHPTKTIFFRRTSVKVALWWFCLKNCYTHYFASCHFYYSHNTHKLINLLIYLIVKGISLSTIQRDLQDWIKFAYAWKISYLLFVDFEYMTK